MKRWIPILALVLIVAGVWFGYTKRQAIRVFLYQVRAPAVPVAERYASADGAVPTSSPPVGGSLPAAVKTKTATGPFTWSGPLPEEKNLAVPFLSQAPKGDWALPYQEACEEASTIMVDAFYKGKTAPFAPDEGDKAILDLIAYEKLLLGKYEDTTAAETARLVRSYFKYKSVVVQEVTDMNDLKCALAHGYPVLVPASGKLLDNPNFRNGGPVYHMLVIKGYTKDGHWITNDAGTRKGADFTYTDENLKNAMHDWNGGDVLNGKPMAIVIVPNK